MFKLTLKVLALTLLVTLGVLFVSGSRASALTDNCSGAPDSNWGYSNGSGSLPSAMSSLMVRAVDTSNGNAPINTGYTLNSTYPGDNNPDLDARIFQWIPGSGPANRQATNTFSTGEHLRGTNAGQQSSCNGWSVLGPGISGYVGNGYVLDCGAAGGEGNVNFWISHVDNPGGVPGTWALYNTTGGIHSIITGDVNSDHGAHIFTESNGNNISLRLEWTPAPTPLSSAGVCNYLNVGNTSPDGNGKTTRTGVYASGIPGIGSPTNVPDDNGGNNSKDWHFYPNANSIDVVTVQQWYKPDTPNKGWHNYTDGNGDVIKYYLKSDGNFAQVTYTNHAENSHPTISCFSAQCSISYVDGDGPGGIVQAGHTMHVHGTYTNTSPAPSSLAIWSPALTVNGSQNAGNNGTHTLWTTSDPPTPSHPPAYTGYGYGFDLYLTAPNSVTQDNFSLTPVYYGGAAIGSPCSGGAPFNPPGGCPPNCGPFVYQKFTGSVSASSALSPTKEHPNRDDYNTSITLQWDNPPASMPNHDIGIVSTNSEFYKLPVGGAKAGIDSNSGGTYTASVGGTTSNTLDNHYNIPAGSYQAGDEYCAHIHSDYTSGWVGPDNTVLYPSSPADDTDCPRVVNEPYFKVYNSDISAGGDFDSCSSTGGTLAGYADVSDPAGVTRGSTTQLSALALLKITGVASAKTSADISGSPTKLTFANTGVQVDTTGNESPVLGGQFKGTDPANPTACRILTNESAPSDATQDNSSNPVISDVGTLSGAKAISGSSPTIYRNPRVYDNGHGTTKLTINGGTLPSSSNNNVSIFVKGDVYIAGNITYGDNWQAGSAPSFVLHATGNIYVAPGVKHLAGLYIAQEKSAGSAGNIYTCATSSFAPVGGVQLYSTCKNQLIVTGSFVAKQVNLMRTFGSLRDEEPHPGTPAGSQVGLVWDRAGPPSNPSLPAGTNCTQIKEPKDPNTWNDNYLCWPNTNSLQMAWTYQANHNGPCKANQISAGKASLSCLQSQGYAYCTPWNPSGVDSKYSWSDDVLCMNQKVPSSTDTPLIQFSNNDQSASDPTRYCTNIQENGPDGNWATTGYFLCEPKAAAGSGPTAAGPPFTNCSNPGAIADPDGSGTKTCAGEVFEYSPTLYLSTPATSPPGGGSLQLQSVTSLPPVL